MKITLYRMYHHGIGEVVQTALWDDAALIEKFVVDVAPSEIDMSYFRHEAAEIWHRKHNKEDMQNGPNKIHK